MADHDVLNTRSSDGPLTYATRNCNKKLTLHVSVWGPRTAGQQEIFVEAVQVFGGDFNATYCRA
jgi:hypothetical protein